MWVKKYRPKCMREFVGHKEVVGNFLDWMGRWTPYSKPVLIYGPPGTGKTSMLEAYAGENNLDIVQVNASDCRTAEELKRTIASSVSQKSLFRRGKVFLIDEVDGLAGREDKGGVGELISIIKETKHPVILACNDPYHAKLRELKGYCEPVQFRRLTVWDIERKLKEIADKENIKCDSLFISQLAKMSNGDLRSAINDFETASKGRKEVRLDDLENLGSREREKSIFDAVKILFKTQSVIGAKLSIDGVDLSPDDVFWWVENNIANEYESPAEIANAYEVLGRADLFRQRISRTQNWKLLSYVIDMMTAGVSQAKKDVYRKFTRYEYPKNIILMGRTKEGRRSAKEILGALSTHLHASGRKIKSGYLPYFRQLAKDKDFVNGLSSSLNLEKDAVSDLLKSD